MLFQASGKQKYMTICGFIIILGHREWFYILIKVHLSKAQVVVRGDTGGFGFQLWKLNNTPPLYYKYCIVNTVQ